MTVGQWRAAGARPARSSFAARGRRHTGRTTCVVTAKTKASRRRSRAGSSPNSLSTALTGARRCGAMPLDGPSLANPVRIVKYASIALPSNSAKAGSEVRDVMSSTGHRGGPRRRQGHADEIAAAQGAAPAGRALDDRSRAAPAAAASRRSARWWCWRPTWRMSPPRSSAAPQPATIAFQEPQLGTGHALMVARDHLPPSGEVLVLYGDTPLLTPPTLDPAAGGPARGRRRGRGARHAPARSGGLRPARVRRPRAGGDRRGAPCRRGAQAGRPVQRRHHGV